MEGGKETMPKGLQEKGKLRKKRLIAAAIPIFLQKGYEKTTTAAIAQAAGMSSSSFFAAFDSKEALLLELVQMLYSDQFASSELLLGSKMEPILLYAVETSVQLAITELSEPLRELYIAAYSLPTTTQYINENTAEKLMGIFSDYNPGFSLHDYYEMDIASSGIMRGFMCKQCDTYFTLEDKLRRFLSCSLTLYRVPAERIQQIIEQVLTMNVTDIAGQIIYRVIENARVEQP